MDVGIQCIHGTVVLVYYTWYGNYGNYDDIHNYVHACSQ